MYVISEHLFTVFFRFLFSFLLYIYLCLFFFAYFPVYHKLVNKDLYITLPTTTSIWVICVSPHFQLTSESLELPACPCYHNIINKHRTLLIIDHNKVSHIERERERERERENLFANSEVQWQAAREGFSYIHQAGDL